MKTILLVEDDDHLRELVRDTLGDPETRVLEVRDGEQAVQALRSQHIDLVVLDWMLPGMAGIHVIRMLARHGNAPPTIMVTAKSRDRDVARARLAGVQHYLTKPFSPAELRAKVAETIS